MKTRCVNPYRQNQFYHLNAAKMRTKQTKPEAYIPKRPVIKDSELAIKIRNDYFNDIWEAVAEQLKQAEQKSNEILILFVEHWFGRQLNLIERNRLLTQVKGNNLIVCDIGKQEKEKEKLAIVANMTDIPLQIIDRCKLLEQEKIN